MTTEHEYGFDITISLRDYTCFTEEEYQELSREFESRVEFARRRVEERAARNATMRIADDGVRSDEIHVGDCIEVETFEYDR